LPGMLPQAARISNKRFSEVGMQKSNGSRYTRGVRVFVLFGATAAGALLISHGGVTWAGAAGCANGGK
jgi:hypothetical protein